MIGTFILIVFFAVGGIAAYSTCNLPPAQKPAFAILLIVVIAGLLAYMLK